MLLLALSPFHVRYSQEFRPYSLGTLLVCVALLCLDGFLERSSPRRLAIVFAAFLAALYTLYLGGIVAILAGIAMVGGDSISIDPDRRRTARRALTLSPLFVAGLLIAYLPWLRVMLEAARRTPPSLPPPVTLARYVSLAAFFGTWSFDGGPFTVGVAVFAALVVIGAVAALRDSRLLFFVAWALLGMGVIELVEHFRPHFYSPRHYLPAGIGLVCLAGIGLATLLERSHLTACAGLIALGTLVAFESKGLQAYFVAGRPDWRPVSSFLQKQNAGERIFTENQHTQLCIGFYVLGPHWMLPGNRAAKREIISLDGNPIPLGWAWLPDRNAWLVLAAGPPSERLRQWSARYPSLRFRTGEGDGWATVVHLVR
jgi:hypothetical protein